MNICTDKKKKKSVFKFVFIWNNYNIMKRCLNSAVFTCKTILIFYKSFRDIESKSCYQVESIIANHIVWKYTNIPVTLSINHHLGNNM